jgi:hypothetical protein
MLEMPGQRTVDAGTTPRAILMNTEGTIPLVGPLVIDSVNAYDGGNTNRVDELRAGMLMAQITASKKWVPCKRTRANGAGSSATALIVTDARAFKVGEKLQVGSNANCVISAINYSTNTITLSATKTWSDLDVVYATTLGDGTTTAAGAETCRGVLKEGVRLLSGVVFETTWVDKPATILAGGYFNSSYILGDLAAIKADTAAKLSQCIWSDVQQAL